MPSESTTTPHDPHPQDQQQAQIKVCSSCHCPLSTDSANTPFLVQDHQDLNDTSIVCAPCRARLLAIRTDTPVPTREGFIFAEVERTLLRRAASLQDGDNEADERRSSSNNRPVHPQDDEPALDADMDVEASIQSSQALPSLSAAFESQNLHCRSPPSAAPPPLSCSTAPCPIPPLVAPMKSETTYASLVSSHSPRSPIFPSSVASSSRYRPLDHPTSAPDPYVDITRLRGTQRSGRNSYDVNVTIVDVDFSSSRLCGYLRIRGLTDDWPELTTYFDAEIIGTRHGFLTRQWGATEQEDMLHWARFPAFRHLRHELKKPHYTMKDADRGAVFMRWKEKFVVPDHRVQDINGASFAGFYYVCVDFNPQHTQASQQPPSLPTSPEEEADLPAVSPTTVKPEQSPRARRESVTRGARRVGRSSSRSAAPYANVAKMSGFYFHQNSEPRYQELDLNHVPDRTSTSFEFR
ncbi:hypothetical protein EIP91_003982 [Steccherinum ochraceum]|uniref:Vacuolar import and degradation protein-domain-containing protein n=1 Tax=Steccherinum ochraceum TaxID=92696 RepID=A0A4R0RQ71_9APHY|nr:hypothetical protein EIP91_003982 [Steccherinum ochraceum]